uniref:Uncharacterized protein n=1 Tax=Timema cristinae TaxID=61476 RepID=A0A7R9H0M6_TIMCR|nr:unnamed protein product [Timema cristinae]
MAHETLLNTSAPGSYLFSRAAELSDKSNDSWAENDYLPFRVEPERGILGPEQCVTVKVIFSPLDVFNYKAKLSCIWGDKQVEVYLVSLAPLAKSCVGTPPPYDCCQPTERVPDGPEARSLEPYYTLVSKCGDPLSRGVNSAVNLFFHHGSTQLELRLPTVHRRFPPPESSGYRTQLGSGYPGVSSRSTLQPTVSIHIFIQ